MLHFFLMKASLREDMTPDPRYYNNEDNVDGVINSNISLNTSSVNASDGDEVILATAGYDHTIKFWQAHTGQCIRTLQHADSQVSIIKCLGIGMLSWYFDGHKTCRKTHNIILLHLLY